MRHLLSIVGTSFVITACQASAGPGGTQVKTTPPEAHADVSAKADAGAGTGAAAVPPGLSDAEAEAVCKTIRTGDCERIERCSPKLLAADFGDKAKCIERQVSECKAIWKLPGTKITSDAATACAAKLSARACDDTGPIAAECVIPGVIADNGACMSANQCASGHCEAGNATTCGKCKPRTPPKVIATGTACKTDGDCDSWARCDGGKCAVAGKAKGAKCNQSGSCLYMLNLVCGPGATCVESTALADVGGSCKVDDKKAKVFCKGGYCDGKSSKCVAAKQVDEPCDESARCAPLLHCDATTKKCRALRFETAACFK